MNEREKNWVQEQHLEVFKMQSPQKMKIFSFTGHTRGNDGWPFTASYQVMGHLEMSLKSAR